MSIWTLTHPETAKSLLHNGIDTMIVEADSAAQAKVLAEAYSSVDTNTPWADATAVTLAQDLEGVVFTIVVDADDTPATFAYTAVADDTWADVGTALELLTEVTYTSTWTPEATHGLVGTLLVATGGGTDDVGDKTLAATATGPNGEDLTAKFFGNIVSEGESTDNLTVDILSTVTSLRVIGAYKS